MPLCCTYSIPIKVKWDVITQRIRRCRTCNLELPMFPKEAEFCQPHAREHEARWEKLRPALRDVSQDAIDRAWVTIRGENPFETRVIPVTFHHAPWEFTAPILTATDAEQIQNGPVS